MRQIRSEPRPQRSGVSSALYTVLVLIAAGVLVLVCAFPGLGTLPPAPPLPASADPAAAAWLAQAVTALSPDKCPFVETTVWQRVRLQHLDYESEGRYTGGTGQRYRLEFHTRTGGSKGTLVQVCDGSSLWQGTGAVPGRWVEVRRIRLDKSTAGPVMPASLGAQGFSFSGVAPLLNRLREQMVWVRQEQATLQDADCIQLTGVWPEALVSALAPAGKPWPEDLPNQCRLWLDHGTLWPRRVEWLGAGSAQRPLVEMELRAPRFFQEMSPERCQAEFTFEPGPAPVVELCEPGKQPPSWQSRTVEISVF